MQVLTEQPIVAVTSGLRAYQGGFFQLLVSPEQNEGSLSMVDITIPAGAEPPRHIHTREDEIFHVISGSVDFYIGDQHIIAGPGQTVVGPRNVPHKFKIITPQARLLLSLTPGDFVNYFLDWSQPIAQEPASVQAPQEPPPADLLAQWIRQLNEQFGVAFV